MIRELGFRRWAAWQLVMAAERLYDSHHDEELVFLDTDTGEAYLKVGVISNTYGDGISYIEDHLPDRLKLEWICGEDKEVIGYKYEHR